MPTLNEEEGIVESINSIPIRDLRSNGFEPEILVVDGYSTDNTVLLAEKLGAKVITSERGYGRQYKTGFKAANGDIIITGDSDGTYPFEEILEYIDILESHNLEFLTINRFAKMPNDAMYMSNKIGNFGLTFFTNILFDFQIEDSQSGMWVIRRSALPILRVRSDGMPFSQEIKIEAFSKLKSREISGTYKKRFGETKLSKINDGIKNILHLLHKKIIVTGEEHSLGQ